MATLTATYLVELPFPLVVEGDKETKPTLELPVSLEGFEILLTPQVSTDHRSQAGLDTAWWNAYEVRVRVSCEQRQELLDQLRAQAKGKADSEVSTTAFLSDYDQIALVALNRLLRLQRLQLRDGSARSLDIGEIGKPDWTDGEGVRVPMGGIFYVPQRTRARGGLRPAEAEAIASQLAQPQEWPLHEEILVDALGALARQNLRQAVVEGAVALEVATKDRLFRGSPRTGAVFEALERKRAVRVSVMTLLDEICGAAFGRSLKQENSAVFDNLQHLFEARNRSVHQGECSYVVNDQRHPVTLSEAEKWLREDVETLFTWLDGLP